MLKSSEDTIAILPLGAYEQHAKHLPLETDKIIAEGVVDYIYSKLPPHLKVKILPSEAIGYSIEHNLNKDSKSLTYSEAIERWINIARNCQANNINKIVFFNAHGGNSALLSIVCTELRVNDNMLACATSWSRFLENFPLLTPEQRSFDIHAGLIETSIMLALKPELVNMSKAENFFNKQADFCQNFHYLRAYGKHYFGWRINDLNPHGACGDATGATAELGKAIIDHVAVEFIKLLDDINNFNREDYFNNNNLES